MTIAIRQWLYTAGLTKSVAMFKETVPDVQPSKYQYRFVQLGRFYCCRTRLRVS